MMTRHIFTYFILFLAFSVSAQKSGLELSQDPYSDLEARLHYWEYKLSSPTDTSTIKDIIKRELNLGENDGFRVEHIATSLTATHITFGQTYKGNVVFGGSAKVAISKNNVLFRCIETVFEMSGAHENIPSTFATEANLTQFSNVFLVENRPAYVWQGQQIVAGWYAGFTHSGNRFHDAAWTTNGTLIFMRDRLLYAKDSLSTLKVFNPDPITPINKNYGGIYIDNSDNNQSVLDPLRVTVQLNTTFDNDTFRLYNNYVKLVEADAPINPVVTSLTPNFEFSRTDYQFEQVNAFYHITTFQYYLQSLGYNLVQYPVRVDAQGWNGQDNSSFNFGAQPSPILTFGEGGVDDAEDADVIVHEYGHAVSNSASPNSYNGTERRSLDEAFGDYLAVSYKKLEFGFGSDKVFNWDGHNTFWAGRTVNNPTNYNYKTISSFSSIYTYTTLWNDAMFDIWNQLGKTYTDKLQIEAAYGFAGNMKFNQSALMIIDADTAMSGGANALVIWKAFSDRGILDWNDISELKTGAKPYILKNSVCNAGSPAELLLKNKGFALTLLDVNGRIILNEVLPEGSFTLPIHALSNGMYILHLTKEGALFSEKIIITN